MKVSRCKKPWSTDDTSKSVGVGSSRTARARLEPALRAVGMKTARRVNNPGIDFITGGKVCRESQRKRMDAIGNRMGRYVKLGPTVGSHVLRTGGIAAVRHGVGVVGISEATMRRVNRWTCMARGRLSGRSSFGRLALAR